MMGLLCSSCSLPLALTAIFYFMVALTICSTKECRLQLTEKTKNRSVILENIDIRTCQVDCVEDVFILASCLQSRGPRERVMPSGTNPGNHHYISKTTCGSKVCTSSSVCLEKGCSKVCVQAPSFCDLHNASKTGDMAKVKVILSQVRAGMNCKEWYSRTPVVLAAHGRHRDVVRLLVSNGANVSVVDDFGINILHSACQGGDVALVKYVLTLDKHDINGKVYCGGTPVMLAAENGHREVVELLVSRGANVSFQDNNGNNILHYACRGGHVEVVKYILSQNMADKNSKGWNEMTPVLMAAKNGHREVVELLVGRGANVSFQDNNSNNILHYACRRGHVEVVKYILSQNMADINSRGRKRMTPVLMAAKNGHRDVVKLLFKKGADMTFLSRHGSSILHFACHGGNVDLVKFVLSLNMVDINRKGYIKSRPLLIAAASGNREMVELLVSKGADVALKGFAGRNILHSACVGGNVELVKYVLSLNITDINSRDRKRMTPVLLAAQEGHKEVVELLVSTGASVSLRDKEGNSILHVACRMGHVRVVTYVLSLNLVDIDGRNGKGKTPVMIAAEKGNNHVVELLVSKGADRSLSDNKY